MKMFQALFCSALLVGFSLFPAVLFAADRQVFPSPDDAAKALVAAVGQDDVKGIEALFGSEARAIISSGDPVADRAARQMFNTLAQDSIALERSASGNAILYLGKLEWPFPIPLKETKRGWIFDTEQGKEEIINRRIGKNELTAIETLGAFVEAQEEYFSRKPRGVAEYARRLVSSPNQKDGLFWPRNPKEAISPLGPLVVEAFAAGYRTKSDAARAFHGYRFRILIHQGDAASGGAMSYLDENQRLTRGFAFVAFPAEWGVSGVMTFIVGRDGIVYESNLGPQTVTVAEEMKEFNPGSGWTPAVQK